jgi:hypothetical protein
MIGPAQVYRPRRRTHNMPRSLAQSRRNGEVLLRESPGDMVIYRSRMNVNIQRDFQVFTLANFLAAIAHGPRWGSAAGDFNVLQRAGEKGRFGFPRTCQPR